MIELTFVVQGPIHPDTGTNLKSIRRHYPRSNIILSTWEGADIDGLEFDKLVLSKDPGSNRLTQGLWNNVNRQIISTINGLRAVDTKSAVKTRTDLAITDAKLGRFTVENGTLFQQKVLALDLFFRNPLTSNRLFHIGDIFHYGLTSDLIDLWDIPLEGPYNPSLRAKILNDIPFLLRCAPEQYIWSSFLLKRGMNSRLEYAGDFSAEKYVLSEHSIAGNFVPINCKDLGIRVPDRLAKSDASNVYTLSELQRIISHGSSPEPALAGYIHRSRKAYARFLTRPWLWFK